MKRPHISLIVAHDLNGVIGVNGTIPWHEPQDLKRFKQLTHGDTVVYGLNTFKSLGYKPLKGRINIVITSALNIQEDGFLVARSLDDAIQLATDLGEKHIHICGGSRLYTEAMERDLVDVAFITRVNLKVPYGEDVTFFNEKDAFNDAEKWHLRYCEEDLSEGPPRLGLSTYLRDGRVFEKL